MQSSYPDIFFKHQKAILLVTYHSQNSIIKKNSLLKIWSIFKGFDLEMINFHE